MELENLRQFDKRQFKKIFAVYAKQRRAELSLSLDQLASITRLTVSEIKSIEAGTKSLTQEEFDILCYSLSLNPVELLNIGKITQVQNIISIFKEIDEFYPT